jgi:SAM-dependent methyltransferase
MQTQVHGMWAAVAPAWREHAGYADARGAQVSERMLEAVRPGDEVLELACGPGGLGLLAARRAAHVVLSDVVAEMTEIATERAAEQGIDNIETRVLDLEDIDEPDAAYDVVLCREGLMFAGDPARAAGEIHRVLRPGGRVAIAVWDARERNPWLGLVFDAVSAQLGHPVPPPGIPGPFSLGDADRLAALLASAGFEDVTVGEMAVPLRAGSFEEWWRRTSALAGPLAKVLAALPEPALDALRNRLMAATAPYATASGLELPGASLIGLARRA